MYVAYPKPQLLLCFPQYGNVQGFLQVVKKLYLKIKFTLPLSSHPALDVQIHISSAPRQKSLGSAVYCSSSSLYLWSVTNYLQCTDDRIMADNRQIQLEV
uniref:Uncharacterized protein n=1 Tax=Sphaerodactylus townsendi TaxID=933632 RepID=A0ACB8EKB2_9SAUR